MEYLIIGNGFDLSCNLPTTYRCFLWSVNSIVEYANKNGGITLLRYLPDITIYDVLNSIKDDCNEAKSSLEAYGNIYSAMIINKKSIWSVLNTCNKNSWWNYFLRRRLSNIGWIDFEREIKNVLLVFGSFFENNNDQKPVDGNKRAVFDELSEQYFSQFDFFYDKHDNADSLKRVYDEYLMIHPLDNTKVIIDKEKIAKKLYDELVAFMGIMREYFRVFVDDTLDEIKNSVTTNYVFESIEGYESVDRVISFNYTSTMEKLFNNPRVFHIHGKTDDKIVLGINADTTDEQDVDTTFIPFKKYYQRVICKTDLGYLNELNEIVNNTEKDVHLSIFGHSLDETDRDIIEDLFNAANEITIYYHDKKEEPKLFQNLVRIFGKKKLDSMRVNKNLRFKDKKNMKRFERSPGVAIKGL